MAHGGRQRVPRRLADLQPKDELHHAMARKAAPHLRAWGAGVGSWACPPLQGAAHGSWARRRPARHVLAGVALASSAVTDGPLSRLGWRAAGQAAAGRPGGRGAPSAPPAPPPAGPRATAAQRTRPAHRRTGPAPHLRPTGMAHAVEGRLDAAGPEGPGACPALQATAGGPGCAHGRTGPAYMPGNPGSRARAHAQHHTAGAHPGKGWCCAAAPACSCPECRWRPRRSGGAPARSRPCCRCAS